MNTKDNQTALIQEVQAFIEQHHTLILATQDSQNQPEASYAPFIKHEQQLYVFVSELARHTQNLLSGSGVSALLIEPENTDNRFTRKRLSLHATVEQIERDHPHWQTIIDQMRTTLGETMDLLVTLEDFHLFAFTPTRARFVKGFAQAFEIKGAALDALAQIKGPGHRSAK